MGQDKPTSEQLRYEAERLRATADKLIEYAAMLMAKSAELEKQISRLNRDKITPGLRVMSSKLGKSFTARPSSSLTGASCCSGSRTQRPRFSSDHEAYQSRQPTVGKSRKLSLGPCTFWARCGQEPETDAIAAGKRSAPTILKSWMTIGMKREPKRKPKRKETSCATILAWMGHQPTVRV